MRRSSTSRAALSAALAIAAGLGAETTLTNLAELDLPVFNSDLARADHPPSVDWLIAERDARTPAFSPPRRTMGRSPARSRMRSTCWT